ncbi:MAG: hypothetical protein HRK26_00505 [Rickettsiaceae bacterium H1]|nr:hypothetical protein [Rickettsiaceae bacterium H1]
MLQGSLDQVEKYLAQENKEPNYEKKNKLKTRQKCRRKKIIPLLEEVEKKVAKKDAVYQKNSKIALIFRSVGFSIARATTIWNSNRNDDCNRGIWSRYRCNLSKKLDSIKIDQ